MIPNGVTRVDMHCHSTASQVAKLGIQRSVGLPECATPPEEVYELAKRRGMDFVTITDHDTIDGCLELADRPDCFISEELTTWFAGEPRRCTCSVTGSPPTTTSSSRARRRPRDLRRLSARARDHLRARPSVLRRRRAADGASPAAAGRAFPRLGDAQRLAGARAQHARGGLHRDPRGNRDRRIRRPRRRRHRADLTEAPLASSPEEFLRHVREGRAESRGDQGSAAKWAHSALALATRALNTGHLLGFACGGAGARRAAGRPRGRARDRRAGGLRRRRAGRGADARSGRRRGQGRAPGLARPASGSTPTLAS